MSTTKTKLLKRIGQFANYPQYYFEEDEDGNLEKLNIEIVTERATSLVSFLNEDSIAAIPVLNNHCLAVGKAEIQIMFGTWNHYIAQIKVLPERVSAFGYDLHGETLTWDMSVEPVGMFVNRIVDEHKRSRKPKCKNCKLKCNRK